MSTSKIGIFKFEFYDSVNFSHSVIIGRFSMISKGDLTTYVFENCSFSIGKLLW